MISKPWKLVGKILVVLLALPVIFVLFFILINSIDRSPSPTVLEFQQAWDNRKAVDPAQNGYIYLAGFDAATDELPEVVGEKRIQLSKEIVKGIASDNQDLFRSEYKIEDAFIKEVKTVFDQCATIDKNCIEGIGKNRARISDWAQAENVIGERYAQLIARPHWLELAPVDINLPIPNFGFVMKAQRLALIQEFAALEPGETSRFVALLNADLGFWRTVLRDTDMLITKMIATAAIRNNFLWTNYFLISLDENARIAATPNVVQQIFTDEELSMRRCLIGEWVFSSKAFDETEKIKVPEKLAYNLLFKKQDTVNRSAAAFKKLIDEQAVPFVEFEAEFAVQKEADQHKNSPYGSFADYILNPYNPVGNILLGIADPAYDNYAARTKDLETFRRGLLASIEYMNNESAADVKHSSPYQTKPFVINHAERSIMVNGLTKGAHAQLVYSY